MAVPRVKPMPPSFCTCTCPGCDHQRRRPHVPLPDAPEPINPPPLAIESLVRIRLPLIRRLQTMHPGVPIDALIEAILTAYASDLTIEDRARPVLVALLSERSSVPSGDP